MLPDSFTPDFLRRLELVKIRSRRAFLGTRQGGHVSIKRGHGIEFADYRQYELGDNPRHIDWGVYARSDRLYVKKYQEEQDLNIYVVIDASASMFTPRSDRKWERAREIALALGYVALLEQDTVTVSVPGFYNSPAIHGGRAIHQLSKDLLAIEPSEHRDFLKGLKRAVAQMRFPGVAVVISDLLMPGEELREVFNLLRSKNMDTTAIQVLGPQDIEPLPNLESVIAVDSETGSEIAVALSAEAREDYGALLQAHNTALQEFLAGARISYVQALTTQDLSDFMVNNLPSTGLLR